MARPKTRKANEVRKIIDLEQEIINLIIKDAADNNLTGFKPNAERILREYAKHLKTK